MKMVPVEIYSRVSGYFRPVNQWNKGKRSEFSDRKSLNIKDIGREIADENKTIADR